MDGSRMVARSTTTSRMNGQTSHDRGTRPRDWRQALAVSLWTGLILIVVMLYARRFDGAFSPPDSAFIACLVATIAFGPSLFAWSLCKAARRSRSTPPMRATTAAITLLPPFLLGGAFLSASSVSAISFLATLIVISGTALLLAPANRQQAASFDTDRKVYSHLANNVELWSLPRAGDATSHRVPSIAEVEHSPVVTQQIAEFENVAIPSEAPSIPFGEHNARDYRQQLVRSNSADRGDVLEGSVRVVFAIGQRQANVHIPFVPSFATVPVVECESIDGCNVRLKVGTVQTFGTRIEVKRTEEIDASAIAEIGFAAVVDQTQTHAA